MKALVECRRFELEWRLAGLPALQSSQPGQVRKEAATTIEASAGGWARLLKFRESDTPDCMGSAGSIVPNVHATGKAGTCNA